MLVGVGDASFISLATPFIDDNAPVARKIAWLSIFYMCIPIGIAVGYVYVGLLCEDCIGERESCELVQKLSYSNENISIYFVRGKEEPKSIREASATADIDRRTLGGLRMLSLVLGSRITDASVASIVSSFASLELLDLSGSSISDSGIGMICNGFPQTLSRLLLALCPNITSSEHQIPGCFEEAQFMGLLGFRCLALELSRA